MAKKNSDITKMKEEGKEQGPALNARDRLRGALQQLVHSDNSSDSDDYKGKILALKKFSKEKDKERERALFRKKKMRILGSVKEHQLQNTFVMKLFDRSVDLAQFEETTPLYPICRAWMANAPKINLNLKRERELLKKKRNEKKEKKQKLDDGLLKYVYNLPPPKPDVVIDAELPQPSQVGPEFNVEYLPDKPLPSKDVLLAMHLAHWNDVKQQIKTASLKKELPFEVSKRTLKRIYQCAQ